MKPNSIFYTALVAVLATWSIFWALDPFDDPLTKDIFDVVPADADPERSELLAISAPTLPDEPRKHSEDQAQPSTTELPNWADPSHSSETWSRSAGSEITRYTHFKREVDGAPIIIATRAKAALSDESLESSAFHGGRLLIDANQLGDTTLFSAFHIERAQSGNFATLIPKAPGDDPFEIIRIAEKLAALGINSLEYDTLAHTTTEPNDPRFQDQWHLEEVSSTGHIDAERGWARRNNANGVVVAILDTGVRLSHEDLDDNLWINSSETAGDGIDNDNNGYVDDIHGVDTHAETGNPSDDNGHGTHVAGIVGAEGNNNIGISGVAWSVELMAIRFMNSDGVGYLSDAIEGIDYAHAHGADVINCSFATPSYSSLFSQAIDRARNANSIVVAAAGNESVNISSVASYPAAYTHANVVTVASTDSDGGISSFSNYSSSLVDLAAPGRSILATYHSSNSAYSRLSGTSMAAPVVSGILALARAEYPSDSIESLIERLENGVVGQSELSTKTRTGGYASLFATLSSVDPSLLPNIGFEASGPLILHTGYEASLSASVSSGTGLSYAWVRDNVSLSESSNTFTWTNPSTADSGNYTLTASNGYGDDSAQIAAEFHDSDASLEQATGISGWPWISYGDASFSVINGAIVSGDITHREEVVLQTRSVSEGSLFLDIVVSSEANYDYLHVAVDGQKIASYAGEVNLNDFEIELSAAGQVVTFTYVKDATVSRGSDTVRLSDFRFTSEAIPAIIAQPADLVLINGASATLSFSVENAESATYLWKRNGQTIAQTNGPSIQFHVDSEPTLGSYEVHVLTETTTLVSDKFTVSNATTPRILKLSSSMEVESGDDFALSVNATGESLSYQWVRDNTVLAGETSSVLSVNVSTPIDTGVYWVVVSNAAGSVSSNIVYVEVTGTAPQILSQPESVQADVGDNLVLNIIVNSATPVTYQWYHNGDPIPASDSSSLNVSNLSSEDYGSYTCTVSNSHGSATSQIAIVSESDSNNSNSIVSIGPLRFDVTYLQGGQLESLSNSWTLSQGTHLLLRSEIDTEGVYAFEVQDSNVALSWRINGSDTNPHIENGAYWIILEAGDTLDCVASLDTSKGVSGSLTVNSVTIYLAERGPVAFVPSNLQIIKTSESVEGLIDILSNSSHRLTWTLTPLGSNRSEIGSDDQILGNNTRSENGYYQFSGNVDNAEGTFELPEFYLKLTSQLNHPFTDAAALEDNWIRDPVFGVLNVERYPWVYSSDNGWWFIDTETDSNALWIFDLILGWIRTDSSSFPYAWSRELNDSIYIHTSSASTRWIFSFETRSWQSVGLSSM